MKGSDWLGGLVLSAFFAPLIGMLGALFMSLADHQVEAGNSIISSRDIRRILIVALIAFVVLSIPCAMLFKADRVDAESWSQFIRDHKCQANESRTRTEYHSGGYPGTSRIETIKEYLWRCDNGEYWHR